MPIHRTPPIEPGTAPDALGAGGPLPAPASLPRGGHRRSHARARPRPRAWGWAAAVLSGLAWLGAASGVVAPDPPALLAGRSELAVRTSDGERLAVRLAPGVELQTLTPLRGDGWIAAGVRDGATLVLLRDGSGGPAGRSGMERIAAPESPGRLAASPVPLAKAATGGAGGRLVGLAWLSGASPRSLAVRFAPSLEGDPAAWGETETVAAPAAGSQLALSGAVLTDGSVMLVWSAFDGEDDEILWSRRADGRWSRPEVLGPGDRVPDITPVVVPLGDGALAAWSEFEGGEYRLVTSRWDGDAWSAPAPAGPPGSLFPVAVATEGGAVLAYHDARRRGWTALRVEASGRIAARAELPAGREADRPPVLLGEDAGGARYVAPGTAQPATAPWDLLP